MPKQDQTHLQPVNTTFLAASILAGAGIALLVISFFVFGVDNPKPEWGQYWRIRPLTITPLAGATGGAIFYLLNYLSARKRINKILAVFLGVIIFLIGLWMGIVLGLDGTMWD